MDAISDIFRSMHIESVVQVRLEAGAPWGLTQHAPSAKDGPGAHLPEVVHFGMVARGNCWLSVGSSAEPVALIGGDCFLLAPGSSFVLRDHPRTRPRSMCEIIPADKRGLLQYGGEGAVTSLVLGWFKFSEVSLKPLQRLLPQLILVKSEQAHSFALQSAVQMLASEMAEPGPGSELLVNRLADVLFVQCIRAHIASHASCANGLLRAIFDPKIGLAMRAMHDRIAEPWTLGSLAEEAGMSRSAFAARFKELMGETPLDYLTSWRMFKAGAMVRNGEAKLVDVAKLVGYDSDAAFSKAFKRVVGVSPRVYRQQPTSLVREDRPPDPARVDFT